MSYEVKAVIGDVNPLQYGGWIIGARETHIDCLVIEPIDWEDKGKQGEGIDCLVYHIALDRDMEPDTEWYATSSNADGFKANLADKGITWDEFKAYVSSEDSVKRAWAWKEVADYYGMENLDDCPTRESESSLRKRFALPFWRARKRGVTVYV